MAGYPWARLDVDYFRHPRSMAAGPLGRAIHLASICWSVDQATDGQIEDGAEVDRILRDAGTTRRALPHVISSGLWVPNGHGWEIHDFLQRNNSRETRDKLRANWAETKRKQRARNGHDQDER